MEGRGSAQQNPLFSGSLALRMLGFYASKHEIAWNRQFFAEGGKRNK